MFRDVFYALCVYMSLRAPQCTLPLILCQIGKIMFESPDSHVSQPDRFHCYFQCLPSCFCLTSSAPHCTPSVHPDTPKHNLMHRTNTTFCFHCYLQCQPSCYCLIFQSNVRNMTCSRQSSVPLLLPLLTQPSLHCSCLR